MSALCPFKHLLSSPKSPPPNVILVPFFTYRHPRTLFIHRHPRALRGDPAHEARSIPKFPEISEIKDFEDDGTGWNLENDNVCGDFKDAAVGSGFYYFV